tara:strand:- start:3304 stop:3567 length:264 start_codon:yes stop_codon:yes gene_type:complete
VEPPGGIDSRRGDVTRARARKRARDDPNDARDADDPDARMDDETTVDDDDDDDRGKGADAADWKNISTGDAGGARDGACFDESARGE